MCRTAGHCDVCCWRGTGGPHGCTSQHLCSYVTRGHDSRQCTVLEGLYAIIKSSQKTGLMPLAICVSPLPLCTTCSRLLCSALMFMQTQACAVAVLPVPDYAVSVTQCQWWYNVERCYHMKAIDGLMSLSKVLCTLTSVS